MSQDMKVCKRHVFCAILIAIIGGLATLTILSTAVDARNDDIEFEEMHGHESIASGHVYTSGILIGCFILLVTVMFSVGAIVTLPELEVEIERRVGK